MNIVRITLAAIVAAASFALPAAARESYVQDGAQLFSASTVATLNAKIADFESQTGKEIVVVTVPSLDGATPQDAAEQSFAQQRINGVLIFLAKAEKKDGILGDRASAAFFPPGSFDSIRQAMRGYFRSGDFDAGITNGVDLLFAQYRSHLHAAGESRNRTSSLPTRSSSTLGGGMSLFWLILVLIAGFLIIRALFRAMSGPRIMPPGYGGGAAYGPGYGGYGPGYGGGGFFSGLLGGLGGAWLGNELFGRQDAGGYVSGAGMGDPSLGSGGDTGGWQADAGQADLGNSSFGDFGSAGGGFDGGGGGFDGGGGGDMGGGW